jgi:hypothetical protein
LNFCVGEHGQGERIGFWREIGKNHAVLRDPFLLW